MHCIKITGMEMPAAGLALLCAVQVLTRPGDETTNSTVVKACQEGANIRPYWMSVVEEVLLFPLHHTGCVRISALWVANVGTNIAVQAASASPQLGLYAQAVILTFGHIVSKHLLLSIKFATVSLFESKFDTNAILEKPCTTQIFSKLLCK